MAGIYDLYRLLSTTLTPVREVVGKPIASRSHEALAQYAASRIPTTYQAEGPLSLLRRGNGRAVFSLGDNYVVKAAISPRGVLENSLAGSSSLLPELLHRTDDNLLTVVQRADPPSKKTLSGIRSLGTKWAQDEVRDVQQNPRAMKALEALGWTDLLGKDTFWNDLIQRNVGNLGERPILLDEGILSQSIQSPAVINHQVPSDLWNTYLHEVSNP